MAVPMLPADHDWHVAGLEFSDGGLALSPVGQHSL